MGMFSGGQEVKASDVYEDIKKYMKPRNGKLHVVMINSFSRFLNQQFGCESKYTTQIEKILSLMQADGYEIVDVKFNSIQGQGLTGNMEGFNTLISYY